MAWFGENPEAEADPPEAAGVRAWDLPSRRA
jgi:hypothetical protein